MVLFVALFSINEFSYANRNGNTMYITSDNDFNTFMNIDNPIRSFNTSYKAIGVVPVNIITIFSYFERYIEEDLINANGLYSTYNVSYYRQNDEKKCIYYVRYLNGMNTAVINLNNVLNSDDINSNYSVYCVYKSINYYGNIFLLMIVLFICMGISIKVICKKRENMPRMY